MLIPVLLLVGGTAGCVLASRLSEDSSVSVLLIEQGPIADTWASRVPTISSNLFAKDSLAAQWWSLPMPHADNRSLGVMRGEALGGTTRINQMFYTRGECAIGVAGLKASIVHTSYVFLVQ